MSAHAEAVAALLEELGATVRIDGSSVDARVGSKLAGRHAALAMDALDDALAAATDTEVAIGRASFARGVYAVLAEPAKPGSPPESFEDAAARVAPTLEGPCFALGVAAAGGDPPFLAEFTDGVVVAYSVELDNGFQLLTAPRVAGWGVHPERVEKAALSILFHRTGYAAPKTIEDLGVAVDMYGLGDGYDAARGLILDMFDYPRCRKGVLFAVPTPELVLFTDTDDESRTEAFRAFVARHFAAASFPLSPAIYAFVDGHRQREPIA